jgi:hypothetical protein
MMVEQNASACCTPDLIGAVDDDANVAARVFVGADGAPGERVDDSEDRFELARDNSEWIRLHTRSRLKEVDCGGMPHEVVSDAGDHFVLLPRVETTADTLRTFGDDVQHGAFLDAAVVPPHTSRDRKCPCQREEGLARSRPSVEHGKGVHEEPALDQRLGSR